MSSSKEKAPNKVTDNLKQTLGTNVYVTLISIS